MIRKIIGKIVETILPPVKCSIQRCRRAGRRTQGKGKDSQS